MAVQAVDRDEVKVYYPGLEAIVDALLDGMDAVDKREFLASKCSLLYVAITRARQLVCITGSGEPCGLLPVVGSAR